jgi:hypothetical protein
MILPVNYLLVAGTIVLRAGTGSLIAAHGDDPVSLETDHLDETLGSGLVNTVFKGETLRSMLLNAYGWWKVSQITYIAALVSFGLGTLAAFAAAFVFVTGRRTKTVAEVLPSTGSESQAKTAA